MNREGVRLPVIIMACLVNANWVSAQGPWFENIPQADTSALSYGVHEATYTPFERLRHEGRSVRKHVVPAQDAGGSPEESKMESKGKETEDRIDTEESQVHEFMFRVRTSRLYPQPSRAIATEVYQSMRVMNDGLRERQIHEVLSRPIEKMRYFKTPLTHFVSEIADEYRIPVQLDGRALKDAGVDVESTTIDKAVANVSLRSALYLFLDDLDLTFFVANEHLVISTKEKADEHLVTVLYPVPWVDDIQTVSELIQKVVAPETWNTVGGNGAIESLGRCLIVSQTEEVQEEVLQAVKRVHEAEFLDSLDGQSPPSPRIVTRIYPITASNASGDIASNLPSICNAALGPKGDSDAKVSVLGNRLVVQSSSRPFHVYAAQVIDSVNGVEVTTLERVGSRTPSKLNSGRINARGMGGMGVGMF